VEIKKIIKEFNETQKIKDELKIEKLFKDINELLTKITEKIYVKSKDNYSFKIIIVNKINKFINDNLY